MHIISLLLSFRAAQERSSICSTWPTPHCAHSLSLLSLRHCTVASASQNCIKLQLNLVHMTWLHWNAFSAQGGWGPYLIFVTMQWCWCQKCQYEVWWGRGQHNFFWRSQLLQPTLFWSPLGTQPGIGPAITMMWLRARKVQKKISARKVQVNATKKLQKCYKSAR